jgi:DNA-binding MarR family transcriptional regulator
MTDRLPDDATTRAILQHWREAVPNDRLAHLVRDAARGVTRALQMRLAAHNVTFGHWVFLRILWEEDGLSQRELSARAGLMESTTHTALIRMTEAGYVTRRNLPDNQRRQHVFLTRQGRALKRKLVPLAEQVNEIAADGVSQREIATTRKTLLAVIENLARDEEQSAQEGFAVPSTRAMGNK